MTDRQPQYPGRVLITPEDGSTPYYATLALADEPLADGTPLNAANLFSDAAATAVQTATGQAVEVPSAGFVALSDALENKQGKLTFPLSAANGGTGLTASPSMLTNLGATAAANVLQASPRPGVTGTLPIGNGGTGLTSSPSMLTNLGATTAANVLQASPRPGVTGTLPMGNGGTGQTTAPLALNALIAACSTLTSSTLATEDYFGVEDVSASTGKRVTLANLLQYMQDNLDFSSITVDTSLSSSSGNPLANWAVVNALRAESLSVNNTGDGLADYIAVRIGCTVFVWPSGSVSGNVSFQISCPNSGATKVKGFANAEGARDSAYNITRTSTTITVTRQTALSSSNYYDIPMVIKIYP